MKNEEFYIPEKGDIVWINFDPASGNEIKKRRPGLVVSNYQFNKATLFSVICPITSTIHSSPTRFTLKESGEISGQVIIPQLKSLDIKSRQIEYVEKLSVSDMAKIDQIIAYIF